MGGLTGVVNKIDENAPEYYCLAGIVTDDEADVAIAAGLRRNRTAGWLGCGATKVDEYMCIGCGICTTRCKFDAIHLRKVRDWHAGSFETMPIKAAAGLVKKTGSIVKRTVNKDHA